MQNRLGEVLAELRKEKKLSQRALAEGICTQALISQIEKGKHLPSIEICYQLSQRLNVSLDYLIDSSRYLNYTYIRELHHQIKKFLRERNYEEIYSIVKIEKTSPNYKDSNFKQFILWQEGICTYYLKSDYAHSIDLLNKAMELKHTSDLHSEREVEILHSIGIIHGEEKNNELALKFFERAKKQLSNITYLQNSTIALKIRYSTAIILTRMREYSLSLNHCEEAIKLCSELETSYLLGELYYHKGYNLELLSMYDDAVVEYERSIQFFTFQNNSSFLKYTVDRINDIKNKMYEHTY
ncbi:helix-turn-helix domain-containing protein [Paenibacillus sp. sgz500958]|uniref:helix-turn-helix domain-containing protein n=1 Tax=Paenibacillus sp. sgz500958 TaxID=3242475 RepID=UPI0036D289CA